VAIFIAIKTCVVKIIASWLILFRVSFVLELEKVSTHERPALRAGGLGGKQPVFGRPRGPCTSKGRGASGGGADSSAGVFARSPAARPCKVDLPSELIKTSLAQTLDAHVKSIFKKRPRPASRGTTPDWHKG